MRQISLDSDSCIYPFIHPINNLNNKCFKLLIRTLKEHNLYKLLKSTYDFHAIPLNTLEDAIRVERILEACVTLELITKEESNRFFKDFYNKLNIKKTIIEISNNIINNSSSILVKSKKQPTLIKISLASEITKYTDNCDLKSLLTNDYRFHPFYDVLAIKHNLTPDYLSMYVRCISFRLKNTKINCNETNNRTNEFS